MLQSPALAWNDRGHMLVAQLAWNELSRADRAKVTALLKNHPHYREFLAAERPGGIEEDAWVFLRASTWPDWVKGHYRDEFDRRNWHFIDIPYVAKGSGITPPDNFPDPVNIVRQISWCSDQVRTNPSAKWKAVNLCWVLHLIGDIHQPLHCITYFSKQFPRGDKGGNLALVRLGRNQRNLHSVWDRILGGSTSVASIRSMAQEIAMLEAEQPELTSADLEKHTTPSSWADEGFEAAVEHAYRHGSFKMANDRDNPAHDEIPQLPERYTQSAGKVARIAVAKAGHRLAAQLAALVE